MFCPKCGGQNPDNGKFCRGCGTDLGNVTNALAAPRATQALVDKKGRPISWESAITPFFMGCAFLAVSIILGVSGMGKGWWFWMLIPAFGMLGSGVAKYVQLKKLESGQTVGLTQHQVTAATPNPELPPAALYPSMPVPESRYKTGDLVPPSVTDNTTRHLEIDKEGQTMTLPKQ